jgi:competence protein ComER
MNMGFIGAGSMGAMLVRALVRAAAINPAEIWVSNRSRDRLERLAAELPGIHTEDNATVARECQVIFLCVKPSDTAEAIHSMSGELRREQLLITLAGVVPIPWLESRVPCRVAKMVPAVTQEALKGPCLVIWGSRVGEQDVAALRDPLERISVPVIIPEQHRRACATLASAGPAFLAWMLSAMADAACASEAGLAPEMATALAREMAIGTAALLSDQGTTFDGIVRRVATPGGMTERGIEILSQHLPAIWRQVFQELELRERALRDKLPA